MPAEHEELPHEPADRVTRLLARFLAIESVTGVLLLVATVLAVFLANSPLAGAMTRLWEMPVGSYVGPIDFSRPLRRWINDGLMTLFFFVVALELKRELVHGELRSLRMAAFSLAGAVGGMLVPALLYLSFMFGRPGAHGFGIVMTTDTAFLIGALALLGARVPASLRLYLLSLVIFDDVGAILVVAAGYGHRLSWPALVVVAVLLAVTFATARLGVRWVPLYSLLGVGVWLGLDASGIHPTVAGVILGFMTPARAWISDRRLHAILERVLAYPEAEHWQRRRADHVELKSAGVAAKEAIAPAERLESRLHPWSGFVIMPLFALANAGVQLSLSAAHKPLMAAIVVGLVVGKPAGVIFISWLAVRFGVATAPPGLKWSLLAAGALLTGIGFTMSLFIAGVAFDGAALQAAKLGILAASIVSGAAGLLALGWLTSPWAAYQRRRVRRSVG